MLIQFFIELTALLLVWFGLFWVSDITHEQLSLEAASFYGTRAQHLKENPTISMEDHLEQMTHGVRKSNTSTKQPTAKRYRLFKSMIPWIDFDRLFSPTPSTEVF